MKKPIPFKEFLREHYLEQNTDTTFNMVYRHNIDIGLIIETKDEHYRIIENTGVEISNDAKREMVFDLVEQYKIENK